ncbi:MAG TPA: hypothetical protein VHW64_02800 [Nocardioides sp.]|uniref:hypothetical protein n=1 Tax=Nocardioides sp. TaxID=35761 RepID=UPI002E36AE28|nr:hypothetical protein [Nocardioides sp.]HEX3929607.1 hypothetical protein [Nocardioides sp.]
MTGRQAIAEWAAEARAAMEQRNILVHASWIMRQGPFAVGHRSRRRGPTFELHTLQDFLDIQARMRRVYDEGIATANELYQRRNG